jgi:hypothetical protein
MGIIRKGILGGFKNKVGTVVGSSYRNKDVIKSLPKVSNKPPTVLQTNQRIKFGIITAYLSRISDFIDDRYKKTGATSSMNEAVSYHLKHAMLGVAPNFTIDYPKLQFSSGKLANPATYSVDTVTAGKVDFNWSLDGVNSKYHDATDVINVLAYNADKDKFVAVLAAAPRSALTFSLQMPPDFVGDEVYCYFSFSSTKKSNLHSDSEYVLLIPIA